ncbi:tetratricopeptide repeat protein [Thiohalomonas denitrificans]|uniref:tetratricopeptide repeat protein n=1 Tax=Thiohalomonas denitrificans TaxID=415747 RepID=UPI0026EE2D95|nr:tetratricopeptide repeat protein [Thiohalomonas denitrificans]
MSTVIENLERMLGNGQDSPMLRFGLGKAYLTSKDFQKAAEHLENAIDQDPEYSAAWKLLGRAYMQSARTDEAIRSFAQGIKVAEQKGDIQAAKEMGVFIKRLEKSSDTD